MLHLTVYAGAKSPQPIAQDDLSWSEFVHEVSCLCADESDVAGKLELPAFGPYRLRDGASRSTAGVFEMSAVAAIDLDAHADGSPLSNADIDAMCARITAHRLDAIVHGSPSDAPNRRKVRTYVRLDRPHDPTDAWRVRRAVAALLDVHVDASTRDPSRLFFCGRLRGTPPRVVHVFAGAPLVIDSLELPPPDATCAPTAAADDASRDPARDARIGAVLGALGPARDHAGRKHDVVFAVGGMLRSCGWSRGDAEQLVRTWIQDDAEDVEAGVRTGTEAWRRTLDEPIVGRTQLASLVGPAVSTEVERTIIAGVRRHVAPAETSTSHSREGSILTFGELTLTPTVPTYLIPELEIGPGRPYGWIGKSNASKTLTLQQIMLDVASGKPVLGRFTVPGGPRRVLHLAYEGFAKCEIDYARMMRAAGSDLNLVRANLDLADGGPRLGCDADANVAWLSAEAERYRDGLIVIDPLIEACRGLDENSSEIAGPIYDLERVSRAHAVAIVIAHHTGHTAGDRSRGHSAIEGAWGASVIESKDDASSNMREVRASKRNRYGAPAFAIDILDTDERGAPWEPTTERLTRGDVSWGVSVRARGGPPPPREDAKALRHAKTIQDHAGAVIADLAQASPVERTLTSTQAGSVSGCSGRDWPEVLAACRAQGVVTERRGSAIVLRLRRQGE